MAISHFADTVNIYKEDGTWIEITCENSESAAMLAHDLLDVMVEMIQKLEQEETTNGHVQSDPRVPYKVRIGKFGKAEFIKR
tara:strand:+ start:214 stop:459 length:246 start_codon:yes stop_codon:yes gene_type:complete